MTIEDGEDLRRARERMGLSVYELGALLRLEGSRARQGARVREMESGARPVGAPTCVAVEALLSGWRPAAE
jgi:predicted xylose isomerase-like sugar epimerase